MILDSVLIQFSRRKRLVFGVASLLGLAGVLMATRVTFDSNVLTLLPQRSSSVRSFLRFLQDFGSLDQLYVVFESADDISDHAGLINAVVDRLRRAPEVSSVDAQLFEPGRDWAYLSDRLLFLLGSDGAQQALERFAGPRLDRELIHSRDLLSFPSPATKMLVQQDPLGLFSLLRDRLSREQGGLASDPTKEGYVSADGHSRVVIVKPSGPPFDTDFCKALFARLSSIESEARHTVLPEDANVASVRLEAAGAYRVSLETEQVMRREGVVNAVGSLAMLLVVVVVVFRTPWVLLYGLAPLMLAAILTLGLNGVIQGRLSPATSGSAGLLFGLGIDGVVILYLRFLEHREAGKPVEASIRGLGGAANSVLLAQGTTAATFLALLWVDFPSLRDLGRLVGIGILICCGLTIALLPGLLAVPLGGGGRSRTTPWLRRFVSQRSAPIVWACMVATVVLALASTRLRLDTRIERLQARTRGTVVEEEIASRFGLPGDVLLVIDQQNDLEKILEVDDRLERALTVRAPTIVASGIAALLPPAGAQADVARLIEGSGLTPERVQGEIERAARVAGFRAQTFAPFFEHLPRLLDSRNRITYDDLTAHGLEPLIARFLHRRNGRFESATYLYSREPGSRVDVDALAKITRDVDPSLQLTGLSAIDREAQRGFMPQFIKGIVIGTIAVAILVFIVFRTVRDTLLALMPTAVGFIWSAGLLGLAKVDLDLFSLFAAVTFIGIASDYGIYVLYRHVRERHHMDAVLTKTCAAIIVACATALIGFGTLVTSSYAPLHVFGIVSLVTLTCCLIASVVLLPAVLIVLFGGSAPKPPRRSRAGDLADRAQRELFTR